MKKFISEFKKFIARGNVLERAVGIVIGASFTSIVQSVVKDIINPVIGLIIGRIDFQDLRFVLIPGTEEVGEVAIRYGALLQNILQFLLTALVLFIVVRAFNRFKDKKEKKEEEVKKEVIKEEILLLREIRDSLQNKI